MIPSADPALPSRRGAVARRPERPPLIPSPSAVGRATPARDRVVRGHVMHREPEDRIDPHTPTLLVIYGNTSRKVRPLDRELIVIGRGPGCDLGLVSPEVAPVHCV